MVDKVDGCPLRVRNGWAVEAERAAVLGGALTADQEGVAGAMIAQATFPSCGRSRLSVNRVPQGRWSCHFAEHAWLTRIFAVFYANVSRETLPRTIIGVMKAA
jgi:hypothetical protein